jgi:hypothetical protein
MGPLNLVVQKYNSSTAGAAGAVQSNCKREQPAHELHLALRTILHLIRTHTKTLTRNAGYTIIDGHQKPYKSNLLLNSF